MPDKSAHTYVFVTYAHEDAKIVNQLKTDLTEQEIDLWIDQENLRPGVENWREELRDAIRRSSAVLFAASPAARISSFVADELEIAGIYRRPVYPCWIRGDQWIDARPLGMGTQYIDAREDNYPQAVQKLARLLRNPAKLLHPSGETGPTPSPLHPPPRAHQPRNPYKGLRAFRTDDDVKDFFGREDFVGELIEALREFLVVGREGTSSERLLAVIGASGSGKSSVVQAGLLPKLQEGALPESQNWRYLTMMPGSNPIKTLIQVLTSEFPTKSESISEMLNADNTLSLHLLLTLLLSEPRTPVVLFIDQFEEVFTQTSTEEERRKFLTLLTTAITKPRGPLFVLLTLRADFYDRPLQYPEIGSLIGRHQKNLQSMKLPDFKNVIEKPAQLPDVRLTFEGDLVGDILFDTYGQPGALPLLQFTLEQLVQQTDGPVLTRQTYHKIGKVKGSLANHANSIYDSLPSEEHKTLARALFLRLLEVGIVDQDITRRRIHLSELDLADPEKAHILREVWTIFTNQRLLTTNTSVGAATIEVSHEALIQAWPRLKDWLQGPTTSEDIHIRRELRNAIRAWTRNAKPVDLLYRRSQLKIAQAWSERNLLLLSQDEAEFLQASADQQHKEKLTRRILIGSAIAIIASGGATFYLRSQDVRPTIPLQKLPYTYPGHTQEVFSATWSPDGKRIASASVDGTVQVWDRNTGEILLTYKGHQDVVRSAAWSPDGKRIASASSDRTVQVWDSSSGATLLTYKGHQDVVYNATWSPDGKHIASASFDHTVQVWDGSSGATLLTYKGHPGPVYSATWSLDGKHIASASFDRTVQVWDSSGGATLLTYKGHQGPVYSAVWSPDGKHIASASSDHTVQVWDSNSGTALLTYTKHQDSVHSATWSPDGKRIASASVDGTVQEWYFRYEVTLYTYKGHQDSVHSATWSPDGKHIASASVDGTVQVWDSSTSATLLPYKRHQSPVYGATWSPDGKRIASASEDHTVQVWDSSTGTTLLTYKGHQDVVYSAVWSPDGKHVASASSDHTVQVWDSSSGTALLTYKGHQDVVYSAVWSPDGKHIASASVDHTVQVWDSSTGATLLPYTGHHGPVYSAVWSPNGKYIASASSDHTVQVWDSSTGTAPLTYRGHQDFVYSAVWSPDGKYIASASFDRTVQMWDNSSGATLLTYKGHQNAVRSAAWSRDGEHIASASDDRTVQIWEVYL